MKNRNYAPWTLFVVLAFSVTLVSSCQMYGGKVETVDESFGLAATLIATGYDLVGLAYQKQNITRDKALELRNQLAESESALRIAETAFRAGRTYDTTVFTSTRAVLSIVRAATTST